jgi:ubiquinone biosynthesis protein COQ4
MPLGSLGRTYADFMGREQISADGLVQASMEGGRGPDPDLPPERAWFGARLRDMHDLWHVVTGYNRDLVGEAALLSFTYAQTGNPGIGFIVAVAWLRAGGELRWARAMIREGHRRGRRAAWLPEQEWEDLLALPLAQVRARLGLGEPPIYSQVRSEAAPALA